MSKLPHSAPSPVHHNTGTVAACVVQGNRYKGTVFPCIWQLQGFTSAVNKKNWGLTWENNVRRQQKQHHAVPGVVSSQTSGGSLHSSWLLFYTELLSLSLIYIFHLPSNYLLLFFKTLIHHINICLNFRHYLFLITYWRSMFSSLKWSIFHSLFCLPFLKTYYYFIFRSSFFFHEQTPGIPFFTHDLLLCHTVESLDL